MEGYQNKEQTMRIERCILLSVLVFASTAARAQAQWVATGYLGINVAGDVEAGKGGPGVSVSYFVGGLAFEFDFERYSHFFKDEDVAELLPDPRMDLDTDAMSFMGNVVVPFRLQGTTKLRPYGVGDIFAPSSTRMSAMAASSETTAYGA